jgi:predicted nucleic acid-binding protein
MRVIDTSAWIEWTADTVVGRRLAPYLAEQRACLVPTIVQLELAKFMQREVSEEAAETMLAYTCECEVVPLDTARAVLAADLCRAHKLATADAIVYATAVERDAELVTCDAHFRGLPGVRYYAPKEQ